MNVRSLRFVACVAAFGLAGMGAAVACSTFDAEGDPSQADASSDALPAPDGASDASPAPDGALAEGGPMRRHVYAYGGVRNAYRAEVLGDAGLGAWERYPALDMNRSQFASAALPGAVLTAGGPEIDGGFYTTTVQRAAFDEGGIAGWQNAPSLPTGRDSPKGAATREFVYVSGGLVEGSIPTAEILSALVSDAGMSSWERAGNLPLPAYLHATIVVDDKLYLVASADGGTPTWSASIFPDGGLGDWSSLASIPVPGLASAAIVTVGRRIYLVGSRNDNNGPVADVWKGEIDGAGAILDWRKSATLPSPRSNVCAVVDGDVIYVLGGQFTSTDTLSSVAAGRVDAFGGITWTTLPSMPEGRTSFGCALR